MRLVTTYLLGAALSACGDPGAGSGPDAAVLAPVDGALVPDAFAGKTCGGVLVDERDPATGCARASCDACPVPPGAASATCTAGGACDFACLPDLTKHASGCGPAAHGIASTYGNLTCAITPGRRVKCWGHLDDTGPTPPLFDTPSPQFLAGVNDVRALAGGRQHMCALTGTGAVYCWGLNGSGELGNGTTTDSAAPVVVAGLPGPAIAVSAGTSHSCAVLATGDVWCWGGNRSGVLGRSTTNLEANPPGPITYASPNAIAVESGARHACAVRANGGVLCWGANGSGELGIGAAGPTSLPVLVSGISDAKEVHAHGYASACGTGETCGYTFAVRANGTVMSWGWGSRLLGRGAQTSAVVTPTAIPGMTGIARLGLGLDRVCAIASAGTATCWGAAAYGALGTTGLATSSNYVLVPTAISELGSTIRHLSSGQTHTCAVRDADVVCVGANGLGELGSGATTPSYSATPLAVAGWTFAD